MLIWTFALRALPEYTPIKVLLRAFVPAARCALVNSGGKISHAADVAGPVASAGFGGIPEVGKRHPVLAMPGMGGLRLLRLTRRKPAFRHPAMKLGHGRRDVERNPFVFPVPGAADFSHGCLRSVPGGRSTGAGAAWTRSPRHPVRCSPPAA